MCVFVQLTGCAVFTLCVTFSLLFVFVPTLCVQPVLVLFLSLFVG